MVWRSPPPEGCLSNLALDRLLGLELDEAGRRAARDHLDGCAYCAERLGRLEVDRAQFAAAPPSLSLPPAARRVRFAAIGAAGALAVAVGVLLVIRNGRGDRLAPIAQPDEVTRTKGGVRIGLYVKRGAEVREGESGQLVRPGDAVRFTYTTVAPGYLTIVSRDGSGRVSVYYPDGELAAPVGAAEDELVPGSVILDDVLGPEVVFAVHCAAPIQVARAVEALQSGGERGVAIAGCTTDRLILDKRR